TPDPALLPDLSRVVKLVGRQSLTSSYLDSPVLPELDEVLRAQWPFRPEELTVVDGAMDALDRVAQVIVHLGDRVVVEDPTFPPLLDLLDLLGAEVIGVPVDDAGISLEALRAALAHQPSAIFLQPRAHNPTGVTMTAKRAKAVAALLTNSNAIVVEDDHSGEIASSKLVSIGTSLPARTVHIRSFSKSHGPDLRLAAVGGAGDVVAAVANRRLLGPGWSSRILQAVLVALLNDPATARSLDEARAEYTRRRQLVTAVLQSRAVPFTGTDGINLWMRVNDERSALITLAAQGIGAAPGEPFMVRDDKPFLRLTVGLLAGSDAEVEATSRKLADAAGFARLRSGQR
ncbi:MAG TPA: aminotransferase class I/II-fold pyridoxal phosphate-dependent enzyme, partial [Ilumatobacteraceae bacterium]